MGATDLEQIDALLEQLPPEVKLVALMLREITKQQSEQLAKQTEVIAKLTAQVANLQRMLFGPRSERMPTIDEELRRTRPQPEVTVDGDPMPTDEEERKRELRRHSRRKSEPQREANKQTRKELPTHDIEVDVHPLQLPRGMTRDDFRVVGEGTVVERIDYIPGRYVRIRYILETLASKDGEHIVRATPPPGMGKGVQYGPGIHANVVAAKCADSMPLYRIAKRLDRAGVTTARSTLCSMFHRAAELLVPIYEALVEEARRDRYVHADETSLRVQAKGGCKKGWIWTMVSQRAAVFRFDPSRSAAAAETLLGEGQGNLCIDGYSGYNSSTKGQRARSGCWAHARRKVFEALGSAPHAQELLGLIRELYIVEREVAEADELGTAAHLQRRQRDSAAILDRIDAWIAEHVNASPPSFPLGEAIGYLINQRTALRRFLEDPKIALDNNIAERHLRVIAIGRKNFLFAGHDEGAQNLAILQSIVATCQLHGVNPEAYLADVFVHVAARCPVEPLMPWNWTPHAKG
jgi:transposase